MQNGVGVPPRHFDNIYCAASVERLRNTELEQNRERNVRRMKEEKEEQRQTEKQMRRKDHKN
jgi:hypothetical protein